MEHITNKNIISMLAHVTKSQSHNSNTIEVLYIKLAFPLENRQQTTLKKHKEKSKRKKSKTINNYCE